MRSCSSIASGRGRPDRLRLPFFVAVKTQAFPTPQTRRTLRGHSRCPSLMYVGSASVFGSGAVDFDERLARAIDIGRLFSARQAECPHRESRRSGCSQPRDPHRDGPRPYFERPTVQYPQKVETSDNTENKSRDQQVWSSHHRNPQNYFRTIGCCGLVFTWS
jgi:hypothetical protein